MSEKTVDVLVYSDSSAVRQDVIEGVGVKPAKDLDKIHWIEAATAAGAVYKFAEENPSLLILDAESTKVGGMAVAKQIQDQFDEKPKIVLLTARPQDDWLAEWAGADAVVRAPYDPLELQEAVSGVLRELP